MHRVGDIAFLEAALTDGDELLITTATATARVIRLDETPNAA